jgi:uncharacterized protein
MTQPDFERAAQYALDCLEHRLPSDLCYHSLSHTRDSVVPAAERFGAYEAINDEPLLLLKTAAWYHDIGFIEHRNEHEVRGVRIMAMVLPQFGYSRRQIAMIGGMIMATKLPQSPQNLLEEILADADLDVLGRSSFFRHNQDLRDELATAGNIMSDEQWYGSQLQFLKTHRYWTAAAQALRDEGKQRNCEALQALLSTSRVVSSICQ